MVRALLAVVTVCLEWHCCPSPLLLRWPPCLLEGLVWRMPLDSCIARINSCHVLNCPVIPNTHFIYLYSAVVSMQFSVTVIEQFTTVFVLFLVAGITCMQLYMQ